MADQSLIDSAVSPPQAASVIDSALAPAQTSSKIDAALVPSQETDPLRAAAQATSISANPPSILDRISAMLGSQAPEGSVMANITVQRGTRSTPQLIAPEAAMTPMEQFRHPVATG